MHLWLATCQLSIISRDKRNYKKLMESQCTSYIYIYSSAFSSLNSNVHKALLHIVSTQDYMSCCWLHTRTQISLNIYRLDKLACKLRSIFPMRSRQASILQQTRTPLKDKTYNIYNGFIIIKKASLIECLVKLFSQSCRMDRTRQT